MVTNNKMLLEECRLSRDRSRFRQCHLRMMCATALLLSSSRTTFAFAPITSCDTRKSTTIVPRVSSAAVIQRYRTSDSESVGSVSSSDIFSFLPSRLSTIERVVTPKQFQTQVLGEKDALIVVRYYAEVCPSCKSTTPLFRKWSRDTETNSESNDSSQSTNRVGVDNSCVKTWGSSQNEEEPLSIKILEMPLIKETSKFIKDELDIEKLPYCHLYHPQFGLVEEQLVMNKKDFGDFVDTVESWSKGVYEANLDALIKSTSKR